MYDESMTLLGRDQSMMHQDESKYYCGVTLQGVFSCPTRPPQVVSDCRPGNGMARSAHPPRLLTGMDAAEKMTKQDRWPTIILW